MDEPLGWGTHEVPDDASLHARLGPLELRLRRTQGELRALVGREGEDPGNGTVGWTRWAGADVRRIALAPRLPDRALVVQPEDPFHLLPGGEARIYVRVPAHVVVQVASGTPHDLLRVATVVLSDTWWGTVDEGELCYWLSTTARRAVRPDDLRRHLVVCPLLLVNHAEEALPVEKIALRVAHLSIYRAGDALWSDETRVLYTGDVEGSRLEMAGHAPREAGDAVLVAPPERAAAGGFRARTFRRIRSITHLVG